VWLCNCSAIPRYNKDEIDKDIDGVKTWIDKAKEELWSNVGPSRLVGMIHYTQCRLDLVTVVPRHVSDC